MQGRAKFRLGGGLGAPYEARAILRAPLGAAVERRLCDHVLVLVSELVTNSVVHGGASEKDAIELSLAWSPQALRIEVLDRGPGFGASLSNPEREGGWGLQLVEKMADRWGVIRTDATIVWFEVGLLQRSSSRTAA
jgi:anti-sigma regulatory factor (Ser/Thr protein kinase)